MSQPRRRRRRRRKGDRAAGESKRHALERARKQEDDVEATERSSSRARRSGRGRRGRGRPREGRTASPQSSEDLVRAAPKRRPAQLTRPHDGTTLEQVIGELQSSYGVPQNPQEYRLTLRIAEERGDKATVVEEAQDPATEDGRPAPGAGTDSGDRPRREKAPAAPRIRGSEAGDGAASEGTKRKRSRRRRRSKRGPGRS